MKYSISVTTLFLAMVFAVPQAEAASAVGTAKQKVITALSISNASDLDFGSAPPSSPAKIVSPGSSDNAENGSFLVSGQANASYSISLPADGTVALSTGSGGSNETIAVDSFSSFPNGTGTLNGSGSQNLYVGARRAALAASQVVGDYTGTYTITVVY